MKKIDNKIIVNISFWALALAIPFYGCKDDSALIKSVEKEVIAIHDSVMIKTTTLYSYKQQLRQILATNKDTVRIYDLIAKLDAADEAMMVWMDEYEGISKNLSFDENMKSLEAEKDRIIEVKNYTYDAILESVTYIQKHTN